MGTCCIHCGRRCHRVNRLGEQAPTCPGGVAVYRGRLARRQANLARRTAALAEEGFSQGEIDSALLDERCALLAELELCERATA